MVKPRSSRQTAFLAFAALLAATGSPFTRAAENRKFEVRHFPIHLSGDCVTEATLRLPSGLHPGQRVPVLLIFGGFESAGEVLDLVHPAEPVALASFDYPFRAPRRLEFPESLRALPEAKRLFPETVRGIGELVTMLKSMPEIDASRIIAVGASFGSPFVLAAAARDAGISGVVLIHAFGQVPETAEHVVLRSWLPRYGWISRPAAWLLSRVVWLYLGVEDPESDARRLGAEQRVLMITASEDSFIPRAASDSLWEAIRKSRARATRTFMPTDHLMPGAGKLIDRIVREVEVWLDHWSNSRPAAFGFPEGASSRTYLGSKS